MNSWNENSNIANDMARVVKFNFITNAGPGTMTVMVNRGVTIGCAKTALMRLVTAQYKTVEITDYEILEIIADGPSHR